MTSVDETRAAAPADDGFVVRRTAVRPRRGPPLLAAGALLSIAGLAVIGAAQGLGADPDRIADARRDAAASPPAAAAMVPPTAAPTSRAPRATAPLITRPDATRRVMAIDLRPAGSHLFVHGEVFSLRVRSVVVSLEDGHGTVAEAQAVRIQRGSTAFRIGANARFDVHFAVADEVIADGVWVRALAFDHDGQPIAIFHLPVDPPRAVFGLGAGLGAGLGIGGGLP